MTILGTNGDDVLTGTNLADTIDGGEGNDRISGGEGDDVLYGGPGNDWLDGGPGNDKIFGGPGDDVIIFGLFDNPDGIQGGDGMDTLWNEDWVPNLYSLAEHGIEQGIVHIADQYNSAPWREVFNHYDANWTLASRDIANDDGSMIAVTLFPLQASTGEQEVWNYSTSAGKKDATDTLYRGGERTFVNYDDAATEVWTSASFHYDAQKRLASHDVLNDDGSVHRYVDDADGSKPYQWVATIFDTHGTATNSVTLWDDGTITYALI